MEILVGKGADVSMKDNDDVSVCKTMVLRIAAGKFEYLMPNFMISKSPRAFSDFSWLLHKLK